MVQSGLPDCAMEGCKVENVHDQIADDGPLIPGAKVGYNTILSKDKNRLKHFGQTMLLGSHGVLSYVRGEDGRVTCSSWTAKTCFR